MPESRHGVEVTRLQYADGEDTGVHHHDRHQLTYAQTGAVTVSIETAQWVVPPMRAVWIPAGISHSLRAHGATDLRPAYLDTRLVPARLDSIAVVSVGPLLRALIEALHDRDTPTDEERRHLEALFVLQLDPLAARPLQLPTLRDSRLAAIQAALLADPADRRTLSDWGRYCGASERTLTRLFASEANTTFGHWRTQLRLQQALILLAQKTSVTTTAHRCGYQSTSAFIDTFRTALGTTPGKFFIATDGLVENQTAQGQQPCRE